MANLFGNTETVLEVDPNKNYVEELVGEGKKYSDVSALARSRVEADAHIARLEAERRADREEIERIKAEANSLQTLQSVLDRLEADGSRRPPNPNPVTTPVPNSPETPSPNPGNLDEAVQKALEKLSVEQKRKSNQDYVVEVLQTNYGPAYTQVLRDRAKAMGLGEKFLEQLAAEQPKAFIKLFDLNEAPKPVSNPVPGARANPGSVNGQVKNFAYYEAIRKTDPKKYFSNAITQEMMRELEKQGESFYS